ncbi:hypothetical protein OPV22_017706 [Ensete ventricosum]|uniref:Uncharacterized protein n=1 Tax=Ensete ventricosum TaxID=4639 RepID=A0AAV8QTS7_ENSVE|nr:hypothetical protein OPV22_017706 [Ensete ventricosum]
MFINTIARSLSVNRLISCRHLWIPYVAVLCCTYSDLSKILWVYHSAGSSIISNWMGKCYRISQVTWRSPTKGDCMNLMDIS